MNERIACIGGGHMGRAILGGLVRRGHPPAAITVADPIASARVALAEDFGVQVTADNAVAASSAEVVLLAVKPQQMKAVVIDLASHLSRRKPLVLSIAAGITTYSLQQWIGAELPLIRAMPNTPALIGRGATGLYATPVTTAPLRSLAESLLTAIGTVEWVSEEAQMDAVTALSGSGPAYFFLLLECLESAGVALGLPVATARRLALQTAAGSAELARSSELDPVALRVQVTSEGGTTEHALKVFADGNFNGLVSAALNAAARRARELSHEFGGT